MEIYVGSTPLNNPITTQPMPKEPLPGIVPVFPQPGPDVVQPGTCPKCGLKLYPVMGYVCSTPECPTGLGSRFSEPHSTSY